MHRFNHILLWIQSDTNLFELGMQKSQSTLQFVRPSIGLFVHPSVCRKNFNISHNFWSIKDITLHLFSQNPATNTENSAQSRSEHIFMELTLFVYNINSQ